MICHNTLKSHKTVCIFWIVATKKIGKLKNTTNYIYQTLKLTLTKMNKCILFSVSLCLNNERCERFIHNMLFFKCFSFLYKSVSHSG